MLLKKNKLWNWFHPTICLNFFARRCLNNDSFVQNEDIKLFLQQKQVKFFNGWTCYQCSNFLENVVSSDSVQPHNYNNYYVNKTTGDFFCPFTGHYGSWKAFKKLFHTRFDKLFEVDSSKNYQNQEKSSIHDFLSSSIPLIDLDFTVLNGLLSNFKLNILPLKYLNLYDLRYKLDTEQIVIPYYDNSKQNKIIIGMKLIHDCQYFINEDCNKSSAAYTLKPGSNQFQIFGLDKIVCSKKPIVLTANEFDAIAINAFSKNYSAIALPYGITYLPLRLLPFLERFSEIILWFGSNLLSLEAVQTFSKKLVSKRCRAVMPPKIASTGLAAIRCDVNIDEIISTAISTDIKNIETIDDLYDGVKKAITKKEEYAGIPYRRFWNLNKKLKGHRSGELTILTGPTGSGKTTLLSELSLDLAIQGVKTLWGSFEISNQRLLMCMLKQFSTIPLATNMDKIDEIGLKFKQLPIIFMTYSGSRCIEDVIKTMFEATYCYDIKHIIIDNLQFMIGYLSKLDRFAYQDYVVHQFREFASKYNVHITLVVHPRKEDNFIPLQMSSVFGSAKVTQEADNVLILQVRQSSNAKTHPFKYLEVVKNRFDGELGRVKLFFNENNLCMSPQFNNISNNYECENITTVKSDLHIGMTNNMESPDTKIGHKINSLDELEWINQFRHSSDK